MAKLQIDIPNDTHKRLKELAKADERSLTMYIVRLLKAHTGTLPISTITPISLPVSVNVISKEEEKQSNIISKEDKKDDEEPAIIQRPIKKAIKQPTPTVEEFIAFLDKEEIPADDTSLDLFDGIKKQVYKKLELDVFDEAQKIRQERK